MGSTIASNRVGLLICIHCTVAQPTLISFDICHKAAVFVSLQKEETGGGSSFNP
jgi:hypothetical protein|tara:strand:- start:1433 stop:1594 length:162 start_codon:yes stop_codon:yes gene_type:complete